MPLDHFNFISIHEQLSVTGTYAISSTTCTVKQSYARQNNKQDIKASQIQNSLRLCANFAIVKSPKWVKSQRPLMPERMTLQKININFTSSSNSQFTML